MKRGEVFDRVCPVCRTEFKTKNRYQQFCNDGCRDRYGKVLEERRHANFQKHFPGYKQKKNNKKHRS